MLVSLLATVTLCVHFLWVVFALFGGLLVLVWPWVAWVHVPVAAWSSAVFVAGWACPLTPLEKYFRRLAGEPIFRGGFVEHYVFRAICSAGLSRPMESCLGLSLLLWNTLGYWILLTNDRAPVLYG